MRSKLVPLQRAFAFLALLALFFVASRVAGEVQLSFSRVMAQQTADTFEAPLATSTSASYNWAGYVASEGSFSAISATWVVPEVVASERLAGEATWVGIGGVLSGDLIQAGTQSLTQGGKVEYEAWFETLPDVSRHVELSVAAGDSITVALTEVATDRWQVLFVNNTTGKQISFTTIYHSSHSSADWVEESPLIVGGRGAAFLPLVDFGSVVFRAASAVKDGVATTPASAGATPLSLYSRRGTELASPSVLGEDGASFSVTRLQSQLLPV